MKHVFVETNFLIDAARPFPFKRATALLERAVQGNVTLYVPWVAISEARRTITEIIREDLGFKDKMLNLARSEFQAQRLSGSDKQVVDRLGTRAAEILAAALSNSDATIDSVVAKCVTIRPNEEAVEKTLKLFAVKRQKPFDEMILGATLAEAKRLFLAGERDLYMCNLNTKDFSPDNRPDLTAEYAICGITYVGSFDIT